MEPPSGFSPHKLQLPLARTSWAWLIERISFVADEDAISVDLLEMLPETSQFEQRRLRLEIERIIAFRALDEGTMTHYWHARDTEGVDPSTSVYTIASSPFLEEVRANYFLSSDDNPLVHVLLAGTTTCLELIGDNYTQFRISNDVEPLK